MLSQVPPPPWGLNMNAHAEQIGPKARRALVPCERSAWTPRQPCVATGALGLIRFRRHVQRILCLPCRGPWAWRALAERLPQRMRAYALMGAAWGDAAAALTDWGLFSLTVREVA